MVEWPEPGGFHPWGQDDIGQATFGLVAEWPEPGGSHPWGHVENDSFVRNEDLLLPSGDVTFQPEWDIA